MSTDYNVFICHRGLDTKRNVVSVLKGMLSSKGITCFVDYNMDEGTEFNSAIEKAIKSSRVYIVILSPTFNTSTWCLNEVSQIMNIQKTMTKSNMPRKVIPVLYDVKCPMNLDTKIIERSTDAQKKCWAQALAWLENLENGFKYDTQIAFEWEELENIMSEVEDFLISHDIIPSHRHASTLKADMRPDYGSIFICHNKKDTQRNVVSVLRGILRSRGIICSIVDYEQEGIQMKLDKDMAITNARVCVIFLSQSFASKQCLEEVVKIMDVHSSKASSRVIVLPVFYDVKPSVVRNQFEGSTYDLKNVEGSSDERNRWADALRRLSFLKGFEYNTNTTFQWEKLDEIARKLEALLSKEALSYDNGQKCGNLYDQVLEVLESKDFNAKDAFFLGVYNGNHVKFVDLMVQKFRSQFEAFCVLHNVTEERRLSSDLIRKLFSDLLRKRYEGPLSTEDITMYRSHYEQLLRSMRCLVVLDDVGNNIDNIKGSLDLLRDNLRNRSLVVVASRFQQVLQEEVNVHKVISLSFSEDSKGILRICYGNKLDIHEAFFDQLQETFSMLGLDVHSVSKERLCIDSTSLRDSEVILCIISQSLSIEEFEGMISNAAAHRPKVLYVSYGPHATDESASKPCFKLKVNFEESELDKAQFKEMVNEVARILNKGSEKIVQGKDFFPVGLTERVDEMWAKMSSYLSNNSNAVRCFGLLGMGGAGKTTTAESIYNKIHKQFEASFFSMNTRARVAADASSLEPLRREILNSFLSNKQGGESSALDPTKGLFQRELRGIYGLVVLDDVDSKAQVDALYISLCTSLRANSVVLITSRNREVLQHAQPTYIFDTGALSPESSQRLFNWHAFLKPEAPPHLQEVSESVIAACKGLPLSLKVMGAHLYHKSDKRYWDESLTYLTKHQEDIFSVLKLSLDDLKSDQPDSFLDISCFFVGQNDVVTRAYMEGVYEVASTHLSSLSSRCLLSLKTKEEEYFDIEDTTIEMHDQIRDMGRHIVRKEKQNRAWDEETAKDLLKDETTRSALRGLSINSGMTLPREAAKCESLPRLYFLRVIDDGNNSAGKVLKGVRCEELRLLVWRNAPFREVPPGLRSINLRVLDLGHSKIRELPPAPCFMELRYLDLEGTNISSVPDGISFVNLEYMNLSSTKIKELPSGLQCPNLRRLFLWKTQISQVPHGLCSTNLEFLQLSETNISKVPEACLPNLLLLDLSHCKLLSLSAKFDTSMTSLQLLNLNGCRNLEGLHSSIQSLTDLRRLVLRCCYRMTSLPQEMTKLSSLKLLDLDYCTSLQTVSCLPATLHKLDLTYCRSLQTLNASLPNLQQLRASKCRNLSTLPTELGASMRELGLGECDGLEEMNASNQESFFGGLSSLELLALYHCTSLETLSFLPTTLQQLTLNYCSSLQTVNASLPNLQHLEISRCDKLTTLPTGLGASLRVLWLLGCDGVEELLETNPESIFGGLSSLRILHICDLTSLKTLSFLPTSLEGLTLLRCNRLEALDFGSGSPTNLKRLKTWKCPRLISLPEQIESLPGLTIERDEGLRGLRIKRQEGGLGVRLLASAARSVKSVIRRMSS